MSELPPDQGAPVTPNSPPPAPPYTVPPIDYSSLPGPFDFGDFLAFRTMIAVPTIMVLFWIGVAWAVISGLWTMFHGGFCIGFAILLFGPFIVRIQCEFLIVVFRINETLTEIHNTLRGRPKM